MKGLTAVIAAAALVLAGLAYFRPRSLDYPRPTTAAITPPPVLTYAGLTMVNGVCSVTTKKERTFATQGQEIIWMIGSACPGTQPLEIVFTGGDPLQEAGPHAISVNSPLTPFAAHVNGNAVKGRKYPYVYRLNGKNAEPEIVIE